MPLMAADMEVRMEDIIKSRDGKIFNLFPVQEKDIRELKQLCDDTLGVNFYTEENIFSLIHKKNMFFCKLLDNHNIIGYHFHYIKDISAVAKDFHCNEKSMCELSDTTTGISVGVLKSVGIKPEYRKKGLAYQLNAYAMCILFSYNVPSIWAPAWKRGAYVPEQNTLLRLGFSYFKNVPNVWYEKEKLFCPECKKEHCICEAAIYYKLRI